MESDKMAQPYEDEMGTSYRRFSVSRQSVGRMPLQDLNIISTYDEDATTTTSTMTNMMALSKRRVSFNNKFNIKEFNAEERTVHVMHAPEYEEPLLCISSDSSCLPSNISSAMSSTHSEYMELSRSVRVEAYKQTSYKEIVDENCYSQTRSENRQSIGHISKTDMDMDQSIPFRPITSSRSCKTVLPDDSMEVDMTIGNFNGKSLRMMQSDDGIDGDCSDEESDMSITKAYAHVNVDETNEMDSVANDLCLENTVNTTKDPLSLDNTKCNMDMTRGVLFEDQAEQSVNKVPLQNNASSASDINMSTTRVAFPPMELGHLSDMSMSRDVQSMGCSSGMSMTKGLASIYNNVSNLSMTKGLIYTGNNANNLSLRRCLVSTDNIASDLSMTRAIGPCKSFDASNLNMTEVSPSVCNNASTLSITKCCPAINDVCDLSMAKCASTSNNASNLSMTKCVSAPSNIDASQLSMTKGIMYGGNDASDLSMTKAIGLNIDKLGVSLQQNAESIQPLNDDSLDISSVNNLRKLNSNTNSGMVDPQCHNNSNNDSYCGAISASFTNVIDRNKIYISQSGINSKNQYSPDSTVHFNSGDDNMCNESTSFNVATINPSRSKRMSMVCLDLSKPNHYKEDDVVDIDNSNIVVNNVENNGCVEEEIKENGKNQLNGEQNHAQMLLNNDDNHNEANDESMIHISNANIIVNCKDKSREHDFEAEHVIDNVPEKLVLNESLNNKTNCLHVDKSINAVAMTDFNNEVITSSVNNENDSFVKPSKYDIIHDSSAMELSRIQQGNEGVISCNNDNIISENRNITINKEYSVNVCDYNESQEMQIDSVCEGNEKLSPTSKMDCPSIVLEIDGNESIQNASLQSSTHANSDCVKNDDLSNDYVSKLDLTSITIRKKRNVDSHQDTVSDDRNSSKCDNVCSVTVTDHAEVVDEKNSSSASNNSSLSDLVLRITDDTDSVYSKDSGSTKRKSLELSHCNDSVESVSKIPRIENCEDPEINTTSRSIEADMLEATSRTNSTNSLPSVSLHLQRTCDGSFLYSEMEGLLIGNKTDSLSSRMVVEDDSLAESPSLQMDHQAIGEISLQNVENNQLFTTEFRKYRYCRFKILTDCSYSWDFFAGALKLSISLKCDNTVEHAKLTVSETICGNINDYNILFAGKLMEKFEKEVEICRTTSDVSKTLMNIIRHIEKNKSFYDYIIRCFVLNPLRIVNKDRLEYKVLSSCNRLWFNVLIDSSIIWEPIAVHQISIQSFFGKVESRAIERLLRISENSDEHQLVKFVDLLREWKRVKQSV